MQITYYSIVIFLRDICWNIIIAKKAKILECDFECELTIFFYFQCKNTLQNVQVYTSRLHPFADYEHRFSCLQVWQTRWFRKYISLFLHITKFNNFIQIDNNNNNNHVSINRNKNIYIFIYIFSTFDKNTKGYMKKTFKIFNQWIQKNHFLDETFTFNDHGTKRVKNVSKIFDVSGKRVTESSRRKNNNRVMRICSVNWSLVNIESLK